MVDPLVLVDDLGGRVGVGGKRPRLLRQRLNAGPGDVGRRVIAGDGSGAGRHRRTSLSGHTDPAAVVVVVLRDPADGRDRDQRLGTDRQRLRDEGIDGIAAAPAVVVPELPVPPGVPGVPVVPVEGAGGVTAPAVDRCTERLRILRISEGDAVDQRTDGAALRAGVDPHQDRGEVGVGQVLDDVRRWRQEIAQVGSDLGYEGRMVEHDVRPGEGADQAARQKRRGQGRPALHRPLQRRTLRRASVSRLALRNVRPSLGLEAQTRFR